MKMKHEQLKPGTNMTKKLNREILETGLKKEKKKIMLDPNLYHWENELEEPLLERK